MVDTINPNQDQNGTNHKAFYSGFDQPEEVKVNLAKEVQEETKGVKPSPIMTAPIPAGQPVMEAVEQAPVSSPPVTKEPVIETQPVPEAKISEMQTSPKPKETAGEFKVKKSRTPVAWRQVFLVLISGVVLAAILGGATFLGSGFYYQSLINQKNTTLNNLKQDSTNLAKVPAPLNLPNAVVPESNATVTTPAPTVETPVVTPAPATSTLGGKG